MFTSIEEKFSGKQTSGSAEIDILKCILIFSISIVFGGKNKFARSLNLIKNL